MQAQNPEANELRQALLASLLVSAWMVEARDPYTGGHLWRVARLAHALALHSDSTPHEASRIAVARLLHDLGKSVQDPRPILLSGHGIIWAIRARCAQPPRAGVTP